MPVSPVPRPLKKQNLWRNFLVWSRKVFVRPPSNHVLLCYLVLHLEVRFGDFFKIVYILTLFIAYLPFFNCDKICLWDEFYQCNGFNVYNSVGLRTLHNSVQLKPYILPEHFHHPGGNPVPSKQTAPIPTSVLSANMDLPFPGFSY